MIATQQKLKSILKRLNKNIRNEVEINQLIDDIFLNITEFNNNKLMTTLVTMLINSKELNLNDRKNTPENNNIRVLREYLSLIRKRLSRNGFFDKNGTGNEIKNEQYSFTEVLNIVHKLTKT